jgi:nitrogen fixation/metabolism regulation signal transduction histidine kinase
MTRPFRFGMNARLLVSVLTGEATVVVVFLLLQRGLRTVPTAAVALLSLVVALPLIALVVRKIVMRGLRETILAVSDGLLSLTERDYSMRLAALRNDELGQLVHRFNALAGSLRSTHNDSYQREMLLETVLSATSLVVLICNEANRIVFANAAARQFFDCCVGKLEGQELPTILASAPADLQEAARSPTDVLFTCDRGGADGPEVFHLSKRYFDLATQKHTVFLLKPLTRELVRKEVDTWKKVIRVISHELNNSLAPVSSLIHSARRMLNNPEHLHRLEGALDTIEDRTRHLKTFLDGYASFSRLPLPARREVKWPEILAGAEGLYTFRIEGAVPEAPVFVDPGQLQQVLINLLKNALEAGGPAEEVTVQIGPAADGGVELCVLDRGKGMSGEVLKNAVLPFYSTKKSGTGLGLALCREILEAHGGRLSLHPREGGGIAVRCWLPARSPAA